MSTPATPQRPQIIGHRGDLYHAVENTMDSVRSAFLAGANAVELDVQLTADGVPVLYHDACLGGGAGFRIPGASAPGLVSDYTLEQLKAAHFEATAWQAEISKSAGEEMPMHFQIPSIATLDDLLPVLSPDKTLYLELKYPDFKPPATDQLAQAVLSWIISHSLQSQVILISFNRGSLKQIKQLAPDQPIGLDIDGKAAGSLVELDVAKASLNIDYWLPPFPHVTPQVLARAKTLGIWVIPWVKADNPAQERDALQSLMAMDVRGLITNQPGYLANLLMGEGVR